MRGAAAPAFALKALFTLPSAICGERKSIRLYRFVAG